MSADARIAALRRSRPRNRFAIVSAWTLAALTVYAWTSGEFSLGDLFGARAAANLARFLGEARPYALRGEPWSWGAYAGWVADVLGPDAPRAIASTLAMSIAAILLAAAAGLAASLGATRTLATAEPYLPGARPPGIAARIAWRAVVVGHRAGLIFLRSIPEYVWAFLMVSLLGVGAWPAVAALAIHNTGILGRLYAEAAENLPPASPRALRALGAGRASIAVLAIWPRSAGRLLLYLFYRWETCVREATVLGLLGFVSLGWYVLQARAAARVDEMVHWIALGVVLIAAGDAASGWARRRVRRSG